MLHHRLRSASGARKSGGVGIPTDYESYHALAVDASDATGQHNGTIYNGAAIADGYLVMDGVNGYCDNGLYPATSKVTVSAIVNLAVLNKRGVLFGDSDGLSSKTRVLLYVTPTNNWGMQIGDGSTFWFIENIPHGLSANVDYEVQYSIDGTAVRLDVNGTTVINTTSTVALSSATLTPWVFGRLGSFDGATNFYLNGKVKSIYRYHRILTSGERAALTARL